MVSVLRLSICIGATVLLLGVPAAAQHAVDNVNGRPQPVDGRNETTERLDADDPIAAAIVFSDARFGTDEAPYAVLARSDLFADALAGTGLGDGPLLLSPPDGLDDRVAAELARVLPDSGTVYVLGDAAAMADPVEDDIRALGLRPLRLAGPTRVETAIAVAEEMVARHGPVRTIGVARSQPSPQDPTSGWADSVAAGVLAAERRAPLLLTPTDSLHPAAAAWIDRQPMIDVAYVHGGDAAVSSTVEDALRERFPDAVRRLGGSDRAGTAQRIAGVLLDGFTTATHVVINGYADNGWAFGLPAAGWAADNRAVPAGLAAILLVDVDRVPHPTASVFRVCDESRETLIVGGDELVSDRVAEELERLDGTGDCGT